MNFLLKYAWTASCGWAVRLLYLAPARNVKTEVAKKISMLSDAYFLFDGNRLIKASQAGQKPFGPANDGGADWAQFQLRFA